MASSTARTAIERIRSWDANLDAIIIRSNECKHEDIEELFDCLIEYPDSITHLTFTHAELSDEMGVKAARFVAKSKTIRTVSLMSNRLGEPTYLAFAAALCVNTSLWNLLLNDNLPVDKNRVDAAFVHAFRLNTHRLHTCCIYDTSIARAKYLERAADAMDRPTLQELLCGRYLIDGRDFRAVKH